MLVKIYWMIWLALAVAAAIAFVSDTMSAFALVVFGFVAFGLTFMGMIGVLPSMVSHTVHHDAGHEERIDRPVADRRGVRQPIRSAHA